MASRKRAAEEDPEDEEVEEEEEEEGSSQPSNKKRRVDSNQKQRHSMNESRRRARLREKFAQLQEVTECSKKDRYSILDAAISIIKDLELELAVLMGKAPRSQLTKRSKTTSSSKKASRGASPSSSSSVIAPSLSSSSLPASSSFETDNSIDSLGMMNYSQAPTAPPQFILPRGVAAVTFSPEGTLIDCSPEFLELINYTAETCSTQTLWTLTHPIDIPLLKATLQKLILGQMPSFQIAVRIITGSKDVLAVSLFVSPIIAGKHFLAILTASPVNSSSVLSSTSS